MAPEYLSIAAVQPPFALAPSPEANRTIVETGLGLLEQALAKGAALVCLPEYFNVFGLASSDMVRAAADAPRLLDRVAALAARYRSHVVLPMLVADGGQVLNRAFILDDRGQVLGHYDKIHITLTERNDLHITAGGEIRLFDSRHGKLGVAICYDIYFPELFSTLALLRPDVVFFPSLQRSEHELANESLIQTRAMDLRAYLVRSSYGAPLDLAWSHEMMFGQSAVVHPDGTILANAGHYAGLAFAHVPFPFRWQRHPCHGVPAQPIADVLTRDRRPDVYRI